MRLAHGPRRQRATALALRYRLAHGVTERGHHRVRFNTPNDDVIGNMLARCRRQKQLVARARCHIVAVNRIMQQHEPRPACRARPDLHGVRCIAYPCVPCVRGRPADHEVFASNRVAVDNADGLDVTERDGVAKYVCQNSRQVKRFRCRNQAAPVMPRAVSLVRPVACGEFVGQVPRQFIAWR